VATISDQRSAGKKSDGGEHQREPKNSRWRLKIWWRSWWAFEVWRGSGALDNVGDNAAGGNAIDRETRRGRRRKDVADDGEMYGQRQSSERHCRG